MVLDIESVPLNPTRPPDPDDDGDKPETDLCGQHDSGASEAVEVLGEASCDGEADGDGSQNLEANWNWFQVHSCTIVRFPLPLIVQLCTRHRFPS